MLSVLLGPTHKWQELNYIMMKYIMVFSVSRYFKFLVYYSGVWRMMMRLINALVTYLICSPQMIDTLSIS